MNTNAREAYARDVRERLDAEPPRDASSMSRRPRSEAAERARRPLGLGIVPNDDPPGYAIPDDADLDPQREAEKIVADSISHLTEEQLAATVSWRELFEYGIGTAVASSLDDALHTRNRLRAVRKEIADGQAEHAAEIAALKEAMTELRVVVAELKGAAGERARTSGIIRP
jgi:hypothetical protein